MNKNNIFEHIAYEFDMYLYSFQKIIEAALFKTRYGYFENQNLFNTYWDSHFLHLRNLIDFFACDHSQLTDINVNTFFNGRHTHQQFQIDDIIKDKNDKEIIIKTNHNGESREELLSCRIIINKSVDHITSERANFETVFVDKAQINNMTYFQQMTIHQMIKIMPQNIHKFITLLETSDKFKEAYKSEYLDAKIKFDELKTISQNFIEYISKILNFKLEIQEKMYE